MEFIIIGVILILICEHTKTIGKIFLSIMTLASWFAWGTVFSRGDIFESATTLCGWVLAGFPVVAVYFYVKYLSLEEYCAKKKYDISDWKWLWDKDSNR